MARELDDRQAAIDIVHRRTTRPAPLDQPKTRKPRFVSTRPMVYDACETGPCDGGTKLCPSPEACRNAEPAPESRVMALLRRIFGRA